jgi:prepilin-type N-terminal cleavage/methylation domain-containing protein
MIKSNKLCSKEVSQITKQLRSRSAFTLIEILMVILLIAVLALMGITQFQNYAADAKDATVKSNLQVLRRAIASQNAQMRLRCGVTSTAWPSLTSLTANDITTGSDCTTAAVTNASDRVFVSGGLPKNPWGQNQTNSVATSALTTAAQRQTGNCAAGARGASDDGWCYNTVTGEIWANSAHNTGAATGGTEAGF